MSGSAIVHTNRGSHVRALFGVLVSLSAVVVAGCAQGPVRVAAGSSGSVIPWTATPAQAMARPAPQAAARPCRAADLDVAVGAAGAYHDQATQDLRLTNHATDACFFPGVPNMTMLLDDGTQRAASSGQFGTSRVDLQPGQSALALLGTPGTCIGADPSRSRVAQRMTLGAPGGGSVPLQGVYLDTQCGPVTVVMFQVLDAPDPASVPQGNLQLQLSTPTTATRGQVLSYIVTVVNPTSQSISLNPCPAYSQSISQPSSTGAQTVQGTWLLNCATVNQVPPQGSVAFEMKLSVPSGMVAGPAKLFWHLEVADGFGVGAVIALE